ncbi:protein of unknown function [Denitratisoma oestradiolicum]|uniref:Uncharacterized protein n=1 Tax=Denitratisoma oestradiolicum TaxID=311182 RepID=A0A6S6XYL1_9PROT|nr:protein of unknown function [Denitratisoma oestradiolicum]
MNPAASHHPERAQPANIRHTLPREGGWGEGCPVSAPHGRPKGRMPQPGAAQRRTVVTPSLGEGIGGRVVQ